MSCPKAIYDLIQLQVNNKNEIVKGIVTEDLVCIKDIRAKKNLTVNGILKAPKLEVDEIKYIYQKVNVVDDNDLDISGSLDISNDLDVSGTSTFHGKSFFNEDVSFSSDADVSFNGPVYFFNDVSFNEKATFTSIRVDVSDCRATGSDIYPLHLKGDTGTNCAQAFMEDSSYGLRVKTNNRVANHYVAYFTNSDNSGLGIYNNAKSEFTTDVIFNTNFDVSFNGPTYFTNDVSFNSNSDVSFNGIVNFNLGISSSVPTSTVAYKGVSLTDLSSSNGGIGTTYYDLSSVVYVLKKLGLLAK